MQSSNEAVVLSERRVFSLQFYKMVGLSFLVITIIVGIIATIATVITPQPKGYIYYSGFTEGAGFDTFAINVANGEKKRVTNTGNNWEFAPVDGAHALFSTANGSSSEENIQIVVADFAHDSYLNIETPEGYYKRNLAPFTLTKDALLYSARIEPFTGEGRMYDPTLWQVVYGEPESGAFGVIDAAFAPVLLPERTEIVYVKNDGIYVLNYVTQETYQINTGLSNFDASTEIAIAPDRSRAIVTNPGDMSFLVLTLSLSDQVYVQNVTRVRDGQYQFTTPVFSPDSTMYAVLKSQPDVQTTTAEIEIRSVEANYPVRQFLVPDLAIATVKVTHWDNAYILDTAAAHNAVPHDHGHTH